MIEMEHPCFSRRTRQVLMALWWSGLLLKRPVEELFHGRRLSDAEIRLMRYLHYVKQPLSRNRLQRGFSEDCGDLSELLLRMTRDGLLQVEHRREGNEELRLTSEAATFLNRVDCAYIDLVQELLSGCSPGELRRLNLCLNQIWARDGVRFPAVTRKF